MISTFFDDEITSKKTGFTINLLKKKNVYVWDNCAVCSDMCTRRGKKQAKTNKLPTWPRFLKSRLIELSSD